MRKQFLRMLLCGGCLLSALQADTTLGQVEAYLNGFRALSGRFEQLSSDGSFKKGMFKLMKPGRLRMDYDAPDTLQIFTHDNVLYFYDRKNRDVTPLQLDQNMAHLLLQEHIDFDKNFFIDRFEEDDHHVFLSLRRAEAPTMGSLTLVFQQNPLRLKQWIITNAGETPSRDGQKTVVTLIETREHQHLSFETDPRVIIGP